ncbi:LCP family protein [uncultured Clostridium sp.]|uniref:LCP family protein n=1 Tax=uncultured Clostridium sp. TaxID=59620 RepID=UPI0025FB39BF|nr:LCP family protein [uncultured Clostridium sp.]
MNKNKEKRSKKKSLKKRSIIFSISTLLILCVIGTCVAYYIYVRNKIYTKNENIQFQTIEYENKKKDDDEVNYKEVNGITNVLLVGTDGRDVDERARADSIIIATLDNNNKEVRLTSLFRDTLVNIDGHGAQKLNAAMAFGGIDLLRDTIQETYKISIDKYVIINFWGFEAIIDQIGGVEVNVKNYQLNELNKYIGESTGGNDYPVTKSGLQLLNGKQALSYARIRKGVGDEFERTERQREVLFKVAEKLRETKPTKYFGILNSMLDNISTNIEPLDALNMAYTIYKFPSLETKQIHIPLTELSDDMDYGGEVGWVFIMDKEQNTKVLHDFIFNDIEPDESTFDYDALRESLSKYKTGEWKNDYKNITSKGEND